MSRAARIRRIILSTLPFRRALPRQLPTSSQSGCILAHDGLRILLTAAHGRQPGEYWGVEVRTDFQQGQTQLYAPDGGMHYLNGAGAVDDQGGEVDLAYAAVPDDLVSRHQEWTPYHGLIRDDPRRDVTLGPEVLSSRSVYGFHGYPTEGFVGNMNLLAQNQRLEADLRFAGQVGHVRSFKLPHPHPGHAYYRGCSGAAVIDKDGRLAGIVVSGDVEERLIFAVAVNPFIDQITAVLANGG